MPQSATPMPSTIPPIRIGDETVVAGVSVGVATPEGADETAMQLLNRADAAMKSLSEHPDYRALRGRFGSESDLFAYAHVGRWLDNLPKIVKATGGADAARVMAAIAGHDPRDAATAPITGRILRMRTVSQ